MPRLDPSQVTPLPTQGQQPTPTLPLPPTRVPQQPSASPTTGLPTTRTKQLGDIGAEQQIGLREDANAQSWERLYLAQEAANREAAKERDRLKALAANSGVDTTQAQDTAASHVVMLETNKRLMEQALAMEGQAIQPSYTEKFAGLFGDEARVLTQSPARQVVSASQRQIIESALYLATGAAYNSEQLAGMMESMVPMAGESQLGMQAKRIRLESQIALAKVRAGPANLKAQEALDSIPFDSLYPGTTSLSSLAPEMQEQAIWDAAGQTGETGLQEQLKGLPPGMEPSSEVDTIGVPADVQSAYMARLKAIPPGQMTVGKYVNLRREMDELAGRLLGKDFHVRYDLGAVKKYVDTYNQDPSKVSTTLPPYTEELSQNESTMAQFANSELGTGTRNFANAMAMGVPNLLAGEEGREKARLNDAANPKSALAGDTLGSLAPTMAIESLTAKGIAGAFKRGLVTDLTYGTARGTNDSGGDLKEGLIEGGLSGVTGVGGKLAFGGARTMLSPETKAAADELANVNTSVLQDVGLGQVEESVQGLPFVARARDRALASWNNDTVNKILGPVGRELPEGTAAGVDANRAMRQILNEEYNTLRPKISGKVDEHFDRAMQALGHIAQGSKLKKKLWRDEVAPIFETIQDSYDGNSFRDADQALRQLASDWLSVNAGDGIVRPSQYHEMGRLVEKARTQLRALVSRNTPEVADKLKALDTAWSKALRVENASTRAMTAEGVYSPSQMMTSVKALDPSRGKTLSAQGRALGQKETMMASRLLGSKPTPENPSWFQVAALLGSGGGTALVDPAIPAAGGTAIASLYTPGVRELTRTLLARRPKVLEKELANVPLDRIPTVALTRYLMQSRKGEE